MDTDLNVECLPVGILQANCYLVGCPKINRCLVIDPGGDAKIILARLNKVGWEAELIVNTHGHFDHILAVNELREATGAKSVVHRSDSHMMAHPSVSFGLPPNSGVMADRELSDEEEITLGEHTFKVIHTPGHSPGSICLYCDGLLFSGDTLFSLGVGRSDLPGGDSGELSASIRDKLFVLPDDTIVLPGHGPATTIGYEKSNNPFV